MLAVGDYVVVVVRRIVSVRCLWNVTLLDFGSVVDDGFGFIGVVGF